MRIIIKIFIIGLIGLIANFAFATNYAVSPSGTGNSSGSDWNNTMPWSSISFSRNNTYYLMDGSYGSKTFSTVVSGTSLITIKKATASDYGGLSNWVSTMGDGQATFSGGMAWTTNYWVFDGATRDSNDWSDNTAYGFYVDGGVNGNGYKLFNVSSADNITIKYVYAAYDSVLGGTDISANQNHGLYSLSGSNYITMEYCFIKNTSWKAGILIVDSDGPYTFRYNRFENIWKKELISSGSGGNGCNNVTFAYNECKNIAGTGALVFDNVTNWAIYGNWFWSPDSGYSFTDVIFGNWTGDHPSRTETANSVLIYNNTFYQINGATQIQIQNGSGNIARNNLFLGFSSNINGSITTSNNTQSASASIVVNAATGDFHLDSDGAAGAGYSLGSPYNVDMDSVTRGQGSYFDIGTFEYVTAGDSTPPQLSSVTIQASGTSIIFNFDEAVTESGTGSDWSFTMGGAAVTLSSPSVDNDAITYTLSRYVCENEELIELDYTQPINGIKDTAGNDLESIDNFSGTFTNSSSKICLLGISVQ